MNKKGWIKSESEIIEFAKNHDEIINKGCYKNLMLQLNALARHAKGISLTSQRNYYSHMDQFTRFIADNYGMQKLANISGKHIAAFVEDCQNEGKSEGTTKDYLSAIRYFHNQIAQPRHPLPSNDDLQKTYDILLEKRSFGGINRRWTKQEYESMVELAFTKGRKDIARMMTIAYEIGFRIHEAVRIDRSTAESAIRKDLIKIKGKGGLVREVPLTEKAKSVLNVAMKDVERGHKLFVPADKKAHQVIQSVQSFIIRHRDKCTEPNSREEGVHMTFHGLRHSYAYRKYMDFRKEGYPVDTARLKVAELIGHSRDDVTRIYLAEIDEE